MQRLTEHPRFMHEKTLTALHIGNERTERYLEEMRNEIKRHGHILETLSRQPPPAKAVLLRTESRNGIHIIDDPEVVDTLEDDDLDLQIMKETLDTARLLVNTISTRGSIVGQTSSGGGTRRGSSYGQSRGEFCGNSGETMTEVGHWGEGPSTESGGVCLPGDPTDAAPENCQTAQMTGLGTDCCEDGRHSQVIDESYPSSTAPLLDPLELMTELLEDYVSEAEQDLLACRYDKAISHLIKATEQGEEREEAYNWQFDEKLDIGISLATAYSGLEKFDLAERQLHSLLPLAVEKPLKLGEVYYSIASLRRNRYHRIREAALLDPLEKSARYSYRFALNSTIIPKPFLTQSAEIMIEMFEWKEDYVAARIFRARHPKILSIPPSAILDDSAFEQQASPSGSTSYGGTYSSETRSSTSMPSLHTALSPFSVKQPPRTESLGTSLTSAGTMSLQPVVSASFLAKVQEGDVAMTNYLLAKGTNVDQTDDLSGLTPLLIAAKNKHTEVCRALLTNDYARADIHAIGRGRRNVLHIALFGSGGEDMIPLLLEHNADPNVADEEGRTPLHYCVEFNKRRAAQHLLSKDIEKETPDKAGETALYLAIRKKKTELVEVLLKAGAVVDRKNMPRTSKDIEFIVEEHLARRLGSGIEPVVTRQDSVSTALSGEMTQAAASASKHSRRSRLRPRLPK